MSEQIFENVWFKPDPFKLFVAGKLIVRADSLEFQGKKDRVVITHIRHVSFGKTRGDFLNNWVKIEYGDGSAFPTAFFADGSWLGWGGIFGGTKRILDTVQHIARLYVEESEQGESVTTSRPNGKPNEESLTRSDSKWGIFSFLVSLVMIIPGCLILNNTLPSLRGSVFIPLLYCVLPAGYLIGIGLAIAGFREKNRKRLFPILGLIISVVASFPMLLMWALMLMAGQPFVCLENLAACLK